MPTYEERIRGESVLMELEKKWALRCPVVGCTRQRESKGINRDGKRQYRKVCAYHRRSAYLSHHG